VIDPAIDIEAAEFAWKGPELLLAIECFTVARGERVFLKGPSGSGKSTLLGLIGGVLTPRSGTVRLIGTDLSELDASGRDRFRGVHLLGFIFQMFNLIPYPVSDGARECTAPVAVFVRAQTACLKRRTEP